MMFEIISERGSRRDRKHFHGSVFQSVIPRNVRLSEAPSYGQPIVLYEAKSRGASLSQVSREVIANGCVGLGKGLESIIPVSSDRS